MPPQPFSVWTAGAGAPVFQYSTRLPGAAVNLDFESMQGETEHTQLVVRAAGGDVPLQVELCELGSDISLHWRQVGYVYAR